MTPTTELSRADEAVKEPDTDAPLLDDALKTTLALAEDHRVTAWECAALCLVVAHYRATARRVAEMEGRIKDLDLVCTVTLTALVRFEPGDSRAVSDQFVACAVLQHGEGDLESARAILQAALAPSEQPKEHPND